MEVTPMPNRSKLSAVALLAVVFIAGGAAGWLIHESTEHDRRPRGRGPDAMVAYLGRELKLTPAQSDSVRAIFARHRPEIETLWGQVRPRFDSIKAEVRAEIDAQLTPDQRARHQRLVEESEHHRRGDSTKAKPEGGRN
jgi:Spy/CpxP family protein refolding chaperone